MKNKPTNAAPPIKISKRMNISFAKKSLFIAVSIIFALIIGAIFLACSGYNPIKFYSQILVGNFSKVTLFSALIRTTIPLLIIALGLSLAFKMKYWNIGAEGQYLCGALMGFTVGLLLKGSLPAPLGAIISIAVGMISGGILALIPAIFKVKFNTNETILTLMFNYVILYLIQYFVKIDFFKSNAPGIPVFKQLDSALWLHQIGSSTSFYIDTAFFVAIFLVIIFTVYFKKTKHGYEINVVGDSPNTAKYSGMKVGKIMLRTVFLSGMVVGLAGVLQLLGASASHQLSENFTGGIGWTAIIVAWLAKLNPIGIVLVSLLMSILSKGCSWAKTSMNVDSSVADILQGIILFCVLAGDFLINYEIRFRGRTFGEIIAEKRKKHNKDKSNRNTDSDKIQECSDSVCINANNGGEQ
ncbi:MAG: ABC transporter permease [Clostridia bacterium]|nr:ABC transporter permease [Clostridia bacterium]